MIKQHAAALPLRRLQRGAMPTPHGLFRLLIVTVCLNFAHPFAAVAQTNAPAPLPPAAQEALNKGIIAAKVPDYLLAIRYFEEARKLAPQDPVIYLNMGLAESRIPGRELRAIAWFGAYLAAYPDAPNAVAVKEQIAVLDRRNQTEVSRLLNSLQAVASQASPDYQILTLSRMAELWANLGDIEAAAKAANPIPRTAYTNDAWKAIAEAYLKAGDLAGAQRTVIEIQGDKKFGVEIAIIHAQITAGNTPGAREALASMKKSVGLFSGLGNRIKAQLAIAAVQMKIGDSTGAQSGFADAKMIAEKFNNASDKAEALTGIAGAQFKAGDKPGGQITLATAQMTADLIQDAREKSQAHMAIAQVHLNNGNIGRAQQTAERFEKNEKMLVQKAIINLQIRNGDIAGALKTAELIEMDNKSEIQTNIAEVQIQAGDMNGAKNTLEAARRTAEAIVTTSKSHALARLAEAQAKTGDVAGARATLISAQKAVDLIPRSKGYITADEFQRREAQAYVVKTQGKLGVNNPRTVIWLDHLYDSGIGMWSGDCPLNTAPFLDLAGHLKSLPPSNNPREVFDGLGETARKIIKAREIIKQQLKAQIGK